MYYAKEIGTALMQVQSYCAQANEIRKDLRDRFL
jgi:hypothetical protein